MKLISNTLRMFERKINQELKKWAAKPKRKPLIIRGARQVGKTTAIDLFSKEFDHYVYLNLEKESDRAFFERELSISDLINALFLTFKISKENRKILVFIDEIQTSLPAIKTLRYFYEEAPELFVIAAGSLLETVFDNKISFPVGRVEYLKLLPCSFVEFLEAAGEGSAANLLSEIPFPEFAHRRLLELFRNYSIIGGMPEVVDAYLSNDNVYPLAGIYESLIVSMLDDVEKYADSESMIKVIRHTIRHSLLVAGSRITFQGFGGSNYKSREVKEAFQMLEKAFLLKLVYPAVRTSIPVQANYRRSPKVQFLDTGFVNYFAGIQQEMFLSAKLDDVYQGRIAEHITGQELQALHPSVLFELNFWTREKADAGAEVDFIYLHKGMIIPVEVKSGAIGKLRSLHQFVENAPHPFAVRISSAVLSIASGVTPAGKPFKLLNLPFYLINQLPAYLDFLMKEK